METPPPAEVARLVVVSPNAADCESLQRILSPLMWRIHGFSTGRDCLEFLHGHDGVAVLICNKSLPDGEWSDLMRELDSISVRPIFIVSAPVADDRLWAEVLNLGGYDLLWAGPFEAEEVIRVTESGWISWNRARGRSVVPRKVPTLERLRASVQTKAQAVS